jgi:hypothetical protein
MLQWTIPVVCDLLWVDVLRLVSSFHENKIQRGISVNEHFACSLFDPENPGRVRVIIVVLGYVNRRVGSQEFGCVRWLRRGLRDTEKANAITQRVQRGNHAENAKGKIHKASRGGRFWMSLRIKGIWLR